MVSITHTAKAAGVAVRFSVVPDFIHRVVLSYIRVGCSEDGETLFVLLPIADFRFACEAGNTAKVDGLTDMHTDKTAIVRYEGGETLETVISDVADGIVTFADTLKKCERAVLYVMADSADTEKAAFSIGAGGTELKAEGGFFGGSELGYPLILELANEDGKSVIEGGSAFTVQA